MVGAGLFSEKSTAACWLFSGGWFVVRKVLLLGG
jgi:hypothetical protein